MGISKKIRKYEQDSISHFNKKYYGLFLCELGDQMWWSAHKHAKAVYESWGVNHTSIDLNGKGGSLILNLDNPVPAEMHGKFDLVTNYGTVEHVNNQYQAFQNVHAMSKVGGLMIHGFPQRDSYDGHCRYYYTEKFVYQLANACSYEIYNMQVLNMSHKGERRFLIMVTFVKTEGYFIPAEKFKNLDIYDSKNLKRTGNYNERHSNRRPK